MSEFQTNHAETKINHAETEMKWEKVKDFLTKELEESLIENTMLNMTSDKFSKHTADNKDFLVKNMIEYMGQKEEDINVETVDSSCVGVEQGKYIGRWKLDGYEFFWNRGKEISKYAEGQQNYMYNILENGLQKTDYKITSNLEATIYKKMHEWYDVKLAPAFKKTWGIRENSMWVRIKKQE